MILEWINRRYNTHLNEANLVEVKNFALVWNIFEGSICDSHFTISNFRQRLEQQTEEHEFNMTDFEPYMNYFRSRYITNNSINSRFTRLYIENRHWAKYAERILLEDTPEINDIIMVLIIIVYRLRNNLFHGRKEMPSINHQADNFSNANNFLMTLIDNF